MLGAEPRFGLYFQRIIRPSGSRLARPADLWRRLSETTRISPSGRRMYISPSRIGAPPQRAAHALAFERRSEGVEHGREPLESRKLEGEADRAGAGLSRSRGAGAMSSASSRAIRRWFLQARRASSNGRWARRRRARRSCCRAAIAPKASPSIRPTTSAISSASSCRWRW